MLHESVNIARRLSSRNEPDMTQESLYSDEPLGFEHQHCEEIASNMVRTQDLPKSCQKYADIMQSIVSRNSKQGDLDIAFQGMSPGEAHAAMASRRKGILSHAQIQRRMTRKDTKRFR
eukprot:84204_1